MIKHILSRILQILLSTFFIVSSCSRPVSDTQDVRSVLLADKDTLAWTLLQADELIPFPVDLGIQGSAIMVCGLYNGKWIHTFDKVSGESVSGYARAGQGPEEVVKAWNTSFTNDTTICVYDGDTRKLEFYNLSTGTYLTTADVTTLKTVLHNSWAMSDSTALFKYPVRLGDYQFSRGFAIADLRSGEIISDYEFIPDEFVDNTTPLILQSSLAISPDKKHFVSVTTNGGTIEMFEIDNHAIKPLYAKYVFPVEFIEKNGIKFLKPNSEYGFVTVCASNDRVYTTYAASVDDIDATKLAIWDWQGNLLKSYETDYTIYKLAYDTATGTIYGLVVDEEGPALARLNLD